MSRLTKESGSWCWLWCCGENHECLVALRYQAEFFLNRLIFYWFSLCSTSGVRTVVGESDLANVLIHDSWSQTQRGLTRKEKEMSRSTCQEIVVCLSRKIGWIEVWFMDFFYSFFNNLSSLTCSFGPTLYPPPYIENKRLVWNCWRDVSSWKGGWSLLSLYFVFTAKLYQSLKNTLFSGPRGNTGHCH